MRLPLVKVTIQRALLAVAIISGVLSGLLIERVPPDGWMTWGLVSAGLASPILFLVYLLAAVLTYGWRRRADVSQTIGTIGLQHRPRVTVLQLMTGMAVVAVICWVAVMLAPVWWGIFHRPTDAEIAARLRLDAAHWTRLAAENPSLAKEYLRLADHSTLAAERRERRAKDGVL